MIGKETIGLKSEVRRLQNSLVAAGFAIGLSAWAPAALAAPPKTIEPGKLHVAFNADMPMTGLEDGKLIGTDGALLSQIAEKLGLEIVPHQMDWSAKFNQ